MTRKHKPYWLAVHYNDGAIMVHNHFTGRDAWREAEKLMTIKAIRRVHLAERSSQQSRLLWEQGQ